MRVGLNQLNCENVPRRSKLFLPLVVVNVGLVDRPVGGDLVAVSAGTARTRGATSTPDRT